MFILHKKVCQQNILHGMVSLRLHAAYPLAHIHVCMCSNGHPTGLGQDGLMEHILLEIFIVPRLPCV
jgi:hypothetical protein